ncbi:TetR/AcrR family transcriptional regulator [Pontiella sp.]|uniref:TetR/AcrR family transcriptional regulator n=1 Tax=Pontiella sp. TaxID=2837462 RepID=UPI00356335FA
MAGYSTGNTTKDKMIQAAGELAAARGFDNVSTRSIAEQSGENIGSIHYHFGGKDGLLAAVVHDAIDACCFREKSVVDRLSDDPSREELAAAIREIVSGVIADLFLAHRPHWHAQVIYQLLQREDELYEIFRRNVLDPNLDALKRLFRLIDPSLTDQECFIHSAILKMPIFTHANYRNVMLKHLGMDGDYSEDYLKILEDKLVRQTQLLLGLPLS